MNKREMSGVRGEAWGAARWRGGTIFAQQNVELLSPSCRFALDSWAIYFAKIDKPSRVDPRLHASRRTPRLSLLTPDSSRFPGSHEA